MTFYTQLFTSKRGPLAKVWLAAHWERKLTKVHVFECNLETTISDIISPKVIIGLRTSGHLLIGVVKIYSRKAKYLLADCSDALVKIKMSFRPGQTDLPAERFEATHEAITLMEDFTSFVAQLPDPCWNTSNIDVVDHLSLNQSRSEEITLKDDFGTDFLKLMDFKGAESQSHHTRLLDMNLHSLDHYGDTFGDEDEGFDLLDFLTIPSDHVDILEEAQNENPETSDVNHQQDADSMEVETPTLNETTLLSNGNEAFTLEPVAITPNLERKRGQRKRKLLVDQSKELSIESIKLQLSDWSDLVVLMDMAPPTLQLMQWKESGGAKKLIRQPCSTVVAPQITEELFAKSIFQVKYNGVCDEVEVMLRDEEGQRGESVLTTSNVRVLDSLFDPEQTHNTELMDLDHTNDNQTSSMFTQNELRSEFSHPELPSEDSMYANPSSKEMETQSTTPHSQGRSVLDSPDFQERSLTHHTQKLLNYLKSDGETTFSLKALCEGATRSQAATTFFCFLVLKKQKALCLHQSVTYEDIVATPGPKFYE